MIYVYLKLFHSLIASIMLSGLIIRLFNLININDFNKFLKKLYIPVAVLQLFVGISMAHIAGYPIFEEGWIFITLLLLIISIIVASFHIFYSNRLHKFLFILLLSLVIISYSLMIIQPEINLWMM